MRTTWWVLGGALLVGCLPEVEVVENPGVRDLVVADPGLGRTLDLSWTLPEVDGIVRLEIARGDDTSYRDTDGLVDGEDYFYSVFVQYADGTASLPTQASGEPSDGVGPSPPENLTIESDENIGGVTVSWTVPDVDVVRAHVVRRTDRAPAAEDDGDVLPADQVQRIDEAVDGPCNGGIPFSVCLTIGAEPITLFYGVVLEDGAGRKSDLAVVSETVQNTGAPLPSSGFGANPLGEYFWRKNSFLYDWDRFVIVRTLSGETPTGPDDDRAIQSLGRDNGATPTPPPGGEFRFGDTTVEGSTSYDYWLFDVDTAGNFTRQGPATVTTRPTAPANVAAEVLESASGEPTGEIRLTWTNGAEAVNVRVIRDNPNEDPNDGFVVCEGLITTCVDDPPRDGDVIDYELFAFDSSGAVSVPSLFPINAPRAVAVGDLITPLNTPPDEHLIARNTGGDVALLGPGITASTGLFELGVGCDGKHLNIVDSGGSVIWEACLFGGLEIGAVGLRADRSAVVVGHPATAGDLLGVPMAGETIAVGHINSTGDQVTRYREIACQDPTLSNFAAVVGEAHTTVVFQCATNPTVDGFGIAGPGPLRVVRFAQDGADAWSAAAPATPPLYFVDADDSGDVGLAFQVTGDQGTFDGLSLNNDGYLVATLAAADGSIVQRGYNATGANTPVRGVAATTAGPFVVLEPQGTSADLGGSVGTVSFESDDLFIVSHDAAHAPLSAHRWDINSGSVSQFHMAAAGDGVLVGIKAAGSSTLPGVLGNVTVGSDDGAIALFTSDRIRWVSEVLPIDSGNPLFSLTNGALFVRVRPGASLFGESVVGATPTLVLTTFTDHGLP
jgi:hypothetical protein